MIPTHPTVCYHTTTHSSINRCSISIVRSGPNVLSIDISGQNLRILPWIVIQSRNTLIHLIADGNLLNENALNMPIFPRLKTLSIDFNMVRRIPTLLHNLHKSCPQLTSLSLIGNPGWFPPSWARNERILKQYRKTVLTMLPYLHSIDARTTEKLPRNSKWIDSTSSSGDESA
ncbi:hypothetical protein RB195_007809 [Necator americanus]|uniref:Leucine Rich repeat-containing domain protein n=1 Tax=Necator americanus TaxID=51031 RepID=A0ABR1C1Q2_NECAM